MSERRKEPREERRRAQVEVNLMAEHEDATSGNVLTRTRRGCTLPFFGAALLLAGLVLMRPGLG